ncbi:cytidylyltransferase domain-containing protein [Anabaena catenula]|uniref:Glycosyltransferase family protein n=1 Tax=Anabaena catenula FACHB-362 TaxID=2692877 RepID=A0ABR8IYG9_9NOST|nr:glycosyltransferase family protein [Anabaena catenula]MBD2691071.1 glycosyltransferase family protein [Anabaena catenula FACHB-362]
MKTVAIIQARMGSTRLPGKVMKQLCGKTVLSHVISRVQACSLLDKLVVATTTSLADDVIIEEAEKCNVKWFRGSEEDVLERYYLAAKEYQAELIVRVTSDCPLFDPEVLTGMLEYFQTATSDGLEIDYLSNCLRRSYPRGLDAEVFTFNGLEKAFQESYQPYEREHVTPYIYEHPGIFNLHNQTYDDDLSDYRWTLDTEDDWRLIEEIYKNLYREGEIFTTDQIVDFLEENPDLFMLNTHVEQKNPKD